MLAHATLGRPVRSAASRQQTAPLSTLLCSAHCRSSRGTSQCHAPLHGGLSCERRHRCRRTPILRARWLLLTPAPLCARPALICTRSVAPLRVSGNERRGMVSPTEGSVPPGAPGARPPTPVTSRVGALLRHDSSCVPLLSLHPSAVLPRDRLLRCGLRHRRTSCQPWWLKIRCWKPWTLATIASATTAPRLWQAR